LSSNQTKDDAGIDSLNELPPQGAAVLDEPLLPTEDTARHLKVKPQTMACTPTVAIPPKPLARPRGWKWSPL